MNYLIVILLIILSALFSGLTLSLLSLDKGDLKRKASLGNKDAKKVYTVRKSGNLLLCTLLMGNVAVNAAIAIFLGNIASGVVAGLIATGLIVIFGEIIPQAAFSRHALKVGARTAWLVRIFIIVLFPICWPIAAILDKVLGEEMRTIYSKKELIKIVEEHEDSKHSDLDADEERIIKGALSFSDKRVGQIMTPYTDVFAIDGGKSLGVRLLNSIKKEGFTRIPVYRDSIDNVVGILYAKDLINVKRNAKVMDLCHKGKVISVSEKLKLDELLALFIRSKRHLAFVQDKHKHIEGIVSLEDVLEEILKQEILDETDEVEEITAIRPN